MRWISVKDREKRVKPGEIYLVCGRESGSNRPFWTRGFYIPAHSFKATAQEVESEGADCFDKCEEDGPYFWPEGWYEASDYDSAAFQMTGNVMFWAEIDLPIDLLVGGR